jgi:hypothetical protein
MIKRYKIAIIVSVALPLLYVGTYCTLRLTKYFVRQEFLTFGCGKAIRLQYPDDAGPIKEGHTSYTFESERNQIGCGRIQKQTTRPGETILLSIHYPLGELEMYIRGFNTSTMHVLKSVAVFERLDSDGDKVYFGNQSTVDEFVVSRKEQRR